MKKFNLLGVALAVSAGTSLVSCSDDHFNVASDPTNDYAVAFIKEFGVPDPNHDWSMATKAGLQLKSEKPVTVRVYAEIEGVRYIFADLANYQGTNAIPVTIPKTVSQLIVEVNGVEYLCDANGTFDVDNPSVGSRSFTVGDENDAWRHTLTFSEDANDKQTVSFRTDDNPWIRDIIDNPWFSEYLLKDSKDQPLMPNCDLYRAPEYDTEKHDYILGDIDVAALYIRDTNTGDKADDNRPDHIIGVVPFSSSYQIDHESRLPLPYDNANYGISCNGNGTAMPSTQAGNTWNVTTYRINGRSYEYGRGISYWTIRGADYDRNDDDFVAFTRGMYNRNYFQFHYWDDQFQTDCESYCSCLFYDKIPVKLTDGTTRYATVYGMFASPESNAAPRPQKPDVYIIEFYPEKSYLGKVVYTSGGTSYKWRIMAEDLGGIGDWDFNDVVFDYTEIVKDTDDDLFTNGICPHDIGNKFPYRYEVTVTPRAAGGVLPVYIAWEGDVMEPFDYSSLKGKMTSDIDKMEITQAKYEGVFIIGKEIHDWFGVPTNRMVNTTPGQTLQPAESITFVVHSVGNETTTKAPSFSNFHVIRDDNGEITLNDETRTKFGWSLIKEMDEHRTKYLVIGLPKAGDSSSAPQMMCVDPKIGWPTEKTRISDVYTGFADWNEDKSNWNTWYNTVSNSSLIINVPEE